MQAFAPHSSCDWSQFVVTRDLGRLGYEGTSYPERSRADLIADIASGQIDSVASVVEFNAVEGWSRDVTDEVREAVEQIQHEREAA